MAMTDDKRKRESRGGKRPGAGRPKAGKNALRTFSLRVGGQTMKNVRNAAKQADTTPSDLIRATLEDRFGK